MTTLNPEVTSSEIVRGYVSFIRDLPYVVDLARETAMWRSDSYREFEVGSLAYVIKHGVEEPDLIVGANYKESDTPKCCAEVDALMQVEELDSPRILGIVVVGSTNATEIKEVTGIDSKTLPPCHDCVKAIRASEHISDHSPIVSAGIDEDKYQVRTARKLEEMYKSGKDPVTSLHPLKTSRMQERANLFLSRTKNYKNPIPKNAKTIKRPSLAAIASLTLDESVFIA